MGWSKSELEDPRWKKVRHAIKERDGFACTVCGAKKKLHVHHTRYFPRRKPWEYCSLHLVTLCKGCHQAHHAQDKANKDVPLREKFNFWKKFLGENLIEVGEFGIAEFAGSPQNCVIVHMPTLESKELPCPAWFVAKEFGPPDGAERLRKIWWKGRASACRGGLPT